MAKDKMLESIRALIDEQPVPMLEVEELRTYLDGTLSEQQEEQVRERLAASPESAALLAEMIAFTSDTPSEDLAEGDLQDLSSQWQQLQHRLLEDEDAVDAVPSASKVVRPSQIPFQLPVPKWLSIRANSLGLVAGFLLALLLLPLFRQSSAPPPDGPGGDKSWVANTLILDLYPADDQGSRGVGDALPVVAAPGFDQVLLHLVPQDYSGYSSFEAQLVTADGAQLPAIGLLPTPEGTFTLTVPRQLLSRVTAINLFGSNNNGKELLDAFSIDPGLWGKTP